MRTFVGVAAVLALTGLTAAGCSTASYRGASPSMRSFNEVPREPRDVYVGMNWKFSLDRQSAYHAMPYAATASAGAGGPSAVTTTAEPVGN